jgi:hypothetical protein
MKVKEIPIEKNKPRTLNQHGPNLNQIGKPKLGNCPRIPANYANCEGEWNNQFRPVLLLLDMMRCQSAPGARDSVMGENDQNRDSLLELEALWQSLGCPRTKLWLRLRFHEISP